MLEVWETRSSGDKSLTALEQKNIQYIQEMHYTEDNKSDWPAEWSYQALFSCCTNKKGGVAIITSPFKSLKHILIPRDGL